MMKSDSTIRRELRKVEALLKAADDQRDEDTMYGAMQALSWALGMDAARPSILVADRQKAGAGHDERR